MKKLNFSLVALVLAIIFIGIFAVAKVSVEKNAKLKLGGDVEVSRVGAPGKLSVLAFLSLNGKVTSEIMSVRVEVKANEKDTTKEIRPVTAFLKSIDNKYPLYGKMEVTEKTRKNILGSFIHKTINGAVVSRSLLDELGIKSGQHFKIGDKMYVAAAVLVDEPDAPEGSENTPRILTRPKGFNDMLQVNQNYAPDVNYIYRVKLAKKADLDEWRERFQNTFGKEQWQIRDWRDYAPSYITGVKWTFVLVTLLALMTLLIVRVTKHLPGEK